MSPRTHAELLEKIRSLPTDKVEDFVDFLRARRDERQLVKVAGRLSEIAFGGVWDNPDDADYDHL